VWSWNIGDLLEALDLAQPLAEPVVRYGAPEIGAAVVPTPFLEPVVRHSLHHRSVGVRPEALYRHYCERIADRQHILLQYIRRCRLHEPPAPTQPLVRAGLGRWAEV
jgi:hypothetical protein